MTAFPPEADEFSLEGKSALVTGASRGIGEEIATWLALAGARVALLARSAEKLDRVAQKIGNSSFSVPCDLSDIASAEQAVSTVRERLDGAPDIIVSNAGVFTITAIEATSAQEFDTIVRTNLIGPFAIVRGFLAEMKSRGSGHIVTIGSIADRHIFPGNAAYSSTKYGTRALHEVLRAETRGTGVRATLVSPASVDTDIWEPIHYYGSDDRPDRSGMLSATAVGNAVLFAIIQPPDVNIDELRLSRA